LLAK
jgi:hypothetical protein